MATKHFIVGTAGHIDHGKSTLVEALSGTNPDRLPEEQDRGMTIDLGFAHLPIEHEGDEFSLGLVDVPGHADFVKNMVAGVGAIDLALLVVACDDGWMPQTEEHVQILDYLGVKSGVIALTKSDLLEDLELVKTDLADQLEGTIFAEAPVVPVCALGGEGLDELRSILVEKLVEQGPPQDLGKPRLAVDRVFSPKGVGTVVTGTLTGGVLRPGDEATVAPSGFKTSVRGIQNHLRSLDEAHPGMRTALNLADLIAGHETGKEGVGRGDTVLVGEAPAFRTMDVLLLKHDRAVAGQPKSLQSLKDGRKVRVHLGSSSLEAQVFLMDGGSLERGGNTIAQLRFKEPAFAWIGDRFVLRDWGQHGTVCGGVVLQPGAERRGFHSGDRREWLERMFSSLDEPSTFLEAWIEGRTAVPLAELVSIAPFSDTDLEEAAEAAPELLFREGWMIEHEPWEKARARAGEVLTAFHEKHPDETGMPIADLRNELRLPSQEIFDLLLVALEEEGFTRGKGRFASPDHKLELPPELQDSARKIRRALSSDNLLEPPGPSEILQSDPDHQALRFLVETGEVVQLDPKALLLWAGFEEARSKVVAHLEKEGKATASDLRKVLGTTRRILIPLLERLDSMGVTRRMEEFRVLRRKD